MNGTGTGAYRNVSIEDDPEADDPPAPLTAPSPALPRPEQHQESSPPTKVQSPPPSAAPEVIDVETPQSEEPEYLNPLAYTNTLIRQATLPNLPPDLYDFGIPPSPPGSPDTSLSQKLETFRRLRERGLFFNDRLGENKGFRNPRLLEKLRGYVGIEDQYGSNLPASAWDPHAFKEDQFYDKLAEKQKQEFEELQARQLSEQRSAIEFTSSSNVPFRKSAAERVMEGLESRTSSRASSRGADDRDRRKGHWDEKRDERRDERRHYNRDSRDDRRDGRRDEYRSRDRSPARIHDRDRHRDRDRDRGHYRDRGDREDRDGRR